MQHSTLPGTGPWSWLEPGLWVYRSRELDLLGQADSLLEQAAPAATVGGPTLLQAKRRLHAEGVGAATAPASVGGGGHRYVVQAGIQFLAGYRDLNLRDAAGVGHGAILCSDPEWHGRRELLDVIRGSLVGLAATERPGGEEDVAAVSTRAVRTAGGWELTGHKAWVSRVLEADAFVVFARSPEHLGAFWVPAGSPGLTATPVAHAGQGAAGGTTGWSWGELELDRVTVPATAVIGSSVGGVAVFRRHLRDYRPLVAATCLGAAAAAVDRWVELALAGGDSRLSAEAAERLGDLRGRVLLTLGGLITGAARPGGVDGSWSRMVKAQAVQTALDVVSAVEEALPERDGSAASAVRRARRELGAYEEADGAQAPLLRSAGERFVRYSAAILDEISEPTSTMPRPLFEEPAGDRPH